MDFMTAVKTCLTQKYADFQGRARRSEYWWFFLFNFIVTIVLGWIPFVGLIISLALLCPGIAVAVRRMHDTGRTGWWLLLPIGVGAAAGGVMGMAAANGGDVGILGIILGVAYLASAILIIVWFCQRGTVGPNAWGNDPYDEPAMA